MERNFSIALLTIQNYDWGFPKLIFRAFTLNRLKNDDFDIVILGYLL